MAGPWWRIGWRNLGRNRRRTALTAGGLAMGYFGVVVIAGLSKGIVAEMIANGTGIVTGQLQVHAPDYLPERSLYATIGGDAGTDVPRLVHAVEADPGVEAATPRVYAGGLMSAGRNTSGVMFMGVDPNSEPRVSRVLSSIQQGTVPATTRNQVAVGVELARQLGVAVGDTVVIVAPAADGSLGNDLFTIAGVYRTGLSNLDATFVVVPLDALQRLLALAPGRVHEIAARMADPWAAPMAAQRLQASLGGADRAVVVEPWTVYRPEMVDYANLSEGSQWIILVVVFAMAIFGVANTMLMATFERRREFALLLALGATPRGIVGSIAAEAAALGLLSIAFGALVTAPVLVWWHRAPLDLSGLVGGFTMAGALIRPVLRVDYPMTMIFEAAGALVVTALLAALYPAARAARVPPADTLAGR